MVPPQNCANSCASRVAAEPAARIWIWISAGIWIWCALTATGSCCLGSWGIKRMPGNLNLWNSIEGSKAVAGPHLSMHKMLPLDKHSAAQQISNLCAAAAAAAAAVAVAFIIDCSNSCCMECTAAIDVRSTMQICASCPHQADSVQHLLATCYNLVTCCMRVCVCVRVVVVKQHSSTILRNILAQWVELHCDSKNLCIALASALPRCGADYKINELKLYWRLRVTVGSIDTQKLTAMTVQSLRWSIFWRTAELWPPIGIRKIACPGDSFSI